MTYIDPTTGEQVFVRRIALGFGYVPKTEVVHCPDCTHPHVLSELYPEEYNYCKECGHML